MKGNIIQKVEELINETLRKSMREIEGALIKPLSENYPFSSNGIYFLIGRPGAGKSYWIWRHIMITERLLNIHIIIKFISAQRLVKWIKPPKF